MVDPSIGQDPSDATLVAYLDGELAPPERAALEARLATDATLRRRLDDLGNGARNFADAFENLFDAAPAERLAAMLERVKVESAAGGARRSGAGGFRPALIAAGIALLVAGGAVGFVAARAIPATEGEERADTAYWRSVVADYVALYTDETFAGIPDNDAVKSAGLAGVGKKLDLDLTLDKVSLPGLNLKGAILFAYRGMPLAQIAYLSKGHGPVAFCIIANRQPDRSMGFEEREGKNIVHWAKGGRSYLIIGDLPRTELETFAASLDNRVS